MRHRRWITPALGVVVAAALIAPAGARAPAAASKDKALLGAGVIASADVPSTWTPHRQADTAAQDYKSVRACNTLRVAVLASNRVPHALSTEFRDPASLQGAAGAADKVFAFKTVAAAKRYLAAYQSNAAQTCLQQYFVKQVGPTTVTSINSQLTGTGDDNTGYEATIHAASQGQQVTLVADGIAARVGRVVVGFTFLNIVDQHLPERPGIVQAVIGRLGALPQ